ncbi:class I SAM-dependent methyltransferase [candidate division WOR-3 bacterium]|nr:class I SAM-dependent methyltransferase [candidate division WOR-3 bacterium]
MNQRRRKIKAPRNYYYRVHEERYRSILGSGASFRDKGMQSYVARAWQEFKAFSGLATGSKGLESGCGTGINTINISLEGFDMLGLDISSTAIKKASTLAEEKGSDARFEVGDMFETRFPEASFDFIVNIWTLHVVGEQQMRDRHLRECSRILKSGGWFFLHNESSERDILDPEEEIIIEEVDKWNIPEHTKTFTKANGKEVQVSFPAHMPEGLSGRRSLREHHEELNRAGFKILKSWEEIMKPSLEVQGNRIMVAFVRKV